MSRFDLSDAEQYADFLSIMAIGFDCIERWLGHNWSTVSTDIPWAPRAPLARQDLAILDRTAPSIPIKDFAPGADGEAECLGALYVLEGSRLGSKILRKRVAPGLPTNFLADNEPPLAWRDLLRRIEGLSPAELDRAADAASATFDVFLQAASR